jgi:hypothetical protein
MVEPLCDIARAFIKTLAALFLLLDRPFSLANDRVFVLFVDFDGHADEPTMDDKEYLDGNGPTFFSYLFSLIMLKVIL